MNRLFTLLFVVVFSIEPAASHEKPRLAVLTDIGGDPDDQQSMIRLMCYSNELDLVLLAATASGTRGELKEAVTRPDLIEEIVDAYGQIRPNLERHASGWPDASVLRSRIVSGNRNRGEDFIGSGHDTEASRRLLRLIDESCPDSPLNISIWGGQTDLAQALWRIRTERSADAWTKAVSSFRVYDINDQDGIADWMRTQFPGMFYILATKPEGRDKRDGVYRGMYLTGDMTTTSRDWVTQNICATGPLGALYPLDTWTDPNPHGCLKEGDTPSWFFFLPRGGNDPSDPTNPGWGGQFQREPDGWYRDLPFQDQFDPRITVSRWRPEFQKDFAQRMSWCRDSQ